jgi:pimeloyl-ACP methyl ester carboxylesterase
MVYALDSRGQGANGRLNEYHYKDMAEDVYCFAKALKLAKPAVFGWSDGGIVALQTEILHPNTFSLIVASGANVTTDGIIDFDAFAAQFQQYDSLGNLIEPEPLVKMMLTEPNISAKELHTIQCPTLIVAGQLDLVALEHTQYIASCIPNSTTLILEGETHGSHILNNPKMGNIMLDYIKQHGY